MGRQHGRIPSNEIWPTTSPGTSWPTGTGGGNLTVNTITGATTLTDSHQVVLASASTTAYAITLPTAVGRTGKTYHIKKMDATTYAISITPNGVQTIDGAAPVVLSVQYDAIIIISDGANWQAF